MTRNNLIRPLRWVFIVLMVILVFVLVFQHREAQVVPPVPQASQMLPEVDGVQEQFVSVNHILLHVVFAGPAAGHPVLLLHGFPEFWYSWKNQIGPLAKAGFRVIVPDQRGYNLSDKPTGVSNYRLEILTQDMAGLVEALGYEKVALVAHDWGGSVAWNLADRFPEKLDRLAIVNAPHMDSMTRSLSKNPIQILKSWYIVGFQIPWVAENLVFWHWAVHGLDEAGPGMTDAAAQFYKMAWDQPGEIEATIDWYRAAFGALFEKNTDPPKTNKIAVPTLILWSQDDPALDPWLAEDSAAHCTGAVIRYFPTGGHELHRTRSPEFNQALLDFLRTDPPK